MQLQEILTKHIWHCFLGFSLQKPKKRLRGGKLATWPPAIPVLFLAEQLAENRETEIPFWGCLFLFPQRFSAGFCVCPALPRSIQVSIRRTEACMLCSHCTPAVCYSRNVVKHLRESMTNTVSVMIQRQAIEQE